MTKPEPAGANDPRVDAFIEALPARQQSICREVDALVRGDEVHDGRGLTVMQG